MDAVLLALIAAIAAGLPYLSWVGVIDGELFFPAAPKPPFVGLVDGGVRYDSRPGKKDLQSISIGIVAYQSLALDDTGAAIIGSTAQLGDTGKGLIAIGEDLKTLLNDNFLSDAKIHFAHLDAARAATPVDDGGRFLLFKRFDFSYRRYE